MGEIITAFAVGGLSALTAFAILWAVWKVHMNE